MHDCNPANERAAGDVHPGGDWNGDVWKVIHYLRTYRQDLEVYTLDCDWGVGVIKGFSNNKCVPAVSAEGKRVCKELDYSYLSRKRRETLGLRSPAGCYLRGKV